ncbi:F-box family protein [Quillaja saponaria]|uniref:F-box family protein n=1 Tax=Quillaja saponaria TaxID=32244 RepID=A0AAD7PUU6_QUISA|nr:F-box family protein [Quillaja saponaria]
MADQNQEPIDAQNPDEKLQDSMEPTNLFTASIYPPSPSTIGEEELGTEPNASDTDFSLKGKAVEHWDREAERVFKKQRTNRSKTMAGKELPHETNKKKPRKLLGLQSFVWIPNEIMVNIFLKLPDKSLMRFKCVSKTWCAMISDPNLIMEINALKGYSKEVRFGSLSTRNHFRVLGSCSGLLLIEVCRKHDLFIWNPVTGESTQVQQNRHLRRYFRCNAGLGYSTGDYKIVKDPIHGPIYSMRKDSWSNLENFQYSSVYLTSDNMIGTFANSALNWHA